MRFGNICGERDFSQRVRETRPGVSGIFICPIRMATSYRLRVRFSGLLGHGFCVVETRICHEIRVADSAGLLG